MRLLEALEQTPTAALRRMASAHALVVDDSTTRAELIEQVAERLRDATFLDSQLAALSADERAALADARAAGGELRGILIDRDHPGAAEALIERGLLFRIFAAAGPLRGEVFIAPDELLALLPAPPAPEAPPAGEPPPLERRTTDPAFNVFALVSALTRGGGNLEHEVRAWSAEPGGWEWNARWLFLQHLGYSAGLLVRRADGLQAPGPALARLLDDPPGLAERLWRSYLRERAWSELSKAGLGGDDLADTLRLRQALVEAVWQLPEGEWIGLNAFSDWLQRNRPRLVREQLNAKGLVLLESAGWSELEHVLVRYTLLGPLYWLGVVGASANGEQVVLLHRGRHLRRSTEPEACTWASATELLAPPRAQLGALVRAERYLVLNERGRPSRYHLVQSHVAAALGNGGSLAECRRLLVRLTRTPLPSPVADRLNAWEERFGALSMRPAVLVEARTEAELDQALAEEQVRPFVRSRLGPTVIEVAAAEALELAAALRGSGHLPRVDAALRLASEPRRAYAGLVDEQVLEFLLVSLLAFQRSRPERLAELEGSLGLLERLGRQFPPERLAELKLAAERLAGELGSGARSRVPRTRRPRRRKNT